MQLKLLTAALALTMAGSAHALIEDGRGGNGELFLTVWDKVGEISYIYDFNITMDRFLAMVNRGERLPIRLDDNFRTFLDMVAEENRPKMRWALAAGDSVPIQRYITTASQIDLNSPLLNRDFTLLGASLDQMIGDVNADIGSATSLIVTDKSRPSYAGSAQWQDNWGGKANFIATDVVGTSMGLFLLRQTSAVRAGQGLPGEYIQLRFNPPYEVYFSHMANEDGEYGYAAPIPEAQTYALMLAGLGLVGWMARRRKV